MPERCGWCGSDPLYVAYHDSEWGVPVTDDKTLFEFLILEGAQAGLAWITVLRKREGYRDVFDDFDVQRIARYTDQKLERILGDSRIIRNRLKVYAARKNAQAFLAVQKEFGSFASYMWRFVDGEPVHNTWESLQQVPASTPLSDAISKDMKQRGFTFVGTTILYAHMQATGMVNDHLTTCFRHNECRALAGQPRDFRIK
ncbi:MAG: DNA-3-methyladenine glycosylase I [Haliea sp.]|uniref:DNA-3-methyladenine glycosylase I n=1 Tax=Haliea sp. TaxID=1932666 RepID=UPI0032F007D7